MGKKVSQIKIGALLSYVQMGLSILVGIVYTPVMLRILGQGEYGLYSTVASTISTISILSLGLDAGYIRYFAKYKNNNDMDSVYRLNGLFMVIFSIIGFIALLCGIFLTKNLKLIFSTGLSEDEYSTARILMILLSISLALSFPTNVFSHIISANERFVFLKTLGMIKTIGGPLVTLPLLLLGYGSIGMVSVTILITVITDAVYCYYVFVVLKQKFYFANFEKGVFKSLFIYSGFIALNLIAEQINNSVDKILISRYLGTEKAAIYAIGVSLYTYYTNFSVAISGVFTPRIHNMVNETNNNKNEQRSLLTGVFVRVARVQFLIIALVATGFVFFGKEFIWLWAGEGYDDSYYVLIVLAIAAFVPLTQNIGITVQRALNKHKFRGVVYLVMTLINLVLTIFLIPRFGVVGAVVGTGFSLVIGNIIIMNVYYHKKCNINIFLYWKNFWGMFKGTVMPVIIFAIIKKFVSFDSILKFILGVVAYSILYFISMWFFALNSEEKKLFLNPLRKVFKRA